MNEKGKEEGIEEIFGKNEGDVSTAGWTIKL